MALTDKLTAIANAIRSKTGGSDLLTLDEMPQEIQSIQTGGGSTEEWDDIVITSDNNRPPITSYSTNRTERIRAYAFYACSLLESIDCPNTVEIGQSAFESCNSLTEVSFPKATAIQTAAFQDCNSITKADFGSATRFTSAVFRRADSLETLIIRTTTGVASCASATIIASTPIANGTGYIYVPAALIEDYKVATNWATYANQFRAIEDYPEICGDTAADTNGEVS